MKLTCEFVCQPRNCGSRGKSCKALISIGCDKNKPLPSVILVASYMKNKSHADYKLTDNMIKLLDRFLSEGKLTIQLKQPESDLMISKANVQQLRLFYNIIRAAKDGKNEMVGKLNTSKPPSAAQVKKQLQHTTKMNILKREDYPFASSFPNSLTHLKARDCKLRRLDTRLATLKNLVSLDLEGNSIKSETMAGISFKRVACLQSINLSNNQLGCIPSSFWTCLPSGLSSLYISNNNLKSLPQPISCLFPKLAILDVSNNLLEKLPVSLGYCKLLKRLNASGNKLAFVPMSMNGLRNMEIVDLSNNESQLACDWSDLEKNQLIQQNLMVDTLLPTLLQISSHFCKLHKYSNPPIKQGL